MTIRITGDGPKITATGSGSTVLVEISTGQHDPGSFSGVHNDLTGRSTTGAHVGTAVSIDPTGFNNNLDGTITNAQLLAAAVDDLTTGGGGGGAVDSVDGRTGVVTLDDLYQTVGVEIATVDTTLAGPPRTVITAIVDGTVTLPTAGVGDVGQHWHISTGPYELTVVGCDGGDVTVPVGMVLSVVGFEGPGPVYGWAQLGFKTIDAPTSGGAALSDTTPQALGTAAAGTGTAAARDDHVHDMPTAADVGADPAGTAAGLVDDLSGVSNQATARTNLGLGTAAVAATGDFATAAQGTDSRTPTAHKTTHATGGSDALTASDIGAAATSHTHTGTQVTVDASGFNGNLTTSDDTVQEIAQKLDDLVIPAAGIADPGGANDDFLQRKSGAWTYRTPAQVKTDLGVPLNYVAPRVTGEWYSTRGPVATAVIGGTNATTGRLQCIPVYLHAGTIDRIGVYTTSAGSGTTWRLGIYPSDTGGIPDGQARLIDAGTVDMGATAGLLAITISQSIATAGLYWLVCLSDAYSANPTVYAWYAQSMPIHELEGIPTFFASTPERSGWMRTATGVTTGSIPSTCPTLAWANSGPKIAVRAA